MTDGETIRIEMDSEAYELLTQLQTEYASELLSRTKAASGGGGCKITAAELRMIAANEAAAKGSGEGIKATSGQDAYASPVERLLTIRVLLVIGTAVLIGTGVATGAVLIPSVVHNDTSRVLITLATLGMAAVLIGVVGLIAARYAAGHAAHGRGARRNSVNPTVGRYEQESGVGSSLPAGSAIGVSVAQPLAADAFVTAAPGPVAPAPMTAVQLALYAGWTMAVVYGRLQDTPESLPVLRTVHELPPDERRVLELTRLNNLLEQLSSLPGFTAPGLAPAMSANSADVGELRWSLEDLNQAMLSALTTTSPQMQLAYELGRSLRDTANPPLELGPDQSSLASALARHLARRRISRLQGWLAVLSAELPQHAAAVVAASLGRWSELSAVTMGARRTRLKNQDGLAAEMCEYLLAQGETWLMLLTGARSASALLSPEGWVAAAELALRRSAAIVRGILRHYWVAILVIATCLAGILYLAVTALSGAAEVWTVIAAAGGSVGLMTTMVTSAMSRLAPEAPPPVLTVAEQDAMAWAITTMPAVTLTARGVRELRRAGIARTQSLGRI